ncbi:hypothetical protein ACS0TY_028728 [Phlomoides rotata]
MEKNAECRVKPRSPGPTLNPSGFTEQHPPLLKAPLQSALINISAIFSRLKMGSRLGRRVVNFANLPIKLLMPTSFSNITEIALKTIPSASKIEIKRVLESLYGFEVEKVHTLNMDGKKKKAGGILFKRPDYKKAYVTLRNPLSLNPDLFPIRAIEEEKKSRNKQAESSIVEDPETVKKSHWLEGKRDDSRYKKPEGRTFGRRTRRDDDKTSAGSGAKFPWSSMTSFRR